MATHRTDFCIVGAGPAGLTLALTLLRSGKEVVLLERSRAFNRDYRGEILQPGGLALLAQLGALDGARARGCHEHNRFRLVERGRVLLDIDYRRLPAPHNYLLSIPQRHMLEELLALCQQFEEFTYIEGARAARLVEEDGRVRGVEADEVRVEAHCVIAADGRYSKVRQLAGIETDRREAFAHDVLWFKLQAPPDRLLDDVQVYRADGSPVLAYTSVPDSVQIGWTLPHKGYTDIAAQGIAHIKAQVSRAIPPYADLIDAQIQRLSDLSLLDVFAATARTWVRDGLVLIGDSAHTHGPIGAQGINLAVQDAVLLHPVLLESLRTKDASAAFLRRFELLRRPDIDTVLRLQTLQGKAMLSHNRIASAIRPRAARLLAHTPVYGRILRKIAYGNPRIRVSDELFTSGSRPAAPVTS
ncbi:MAG: FAD-binding monooxygenase [Actinobacteria bacterium 13_2_20CM_2_71_6]|nr:MAG: FAD-binding monooxygenase [Actinobacteria bacterium 13_2_20CM_2_71_6]